MPRSAHGIALIESQVADNALATLASKLRAKARRAREQLREEADRDQW